MPQFQFMAWHPLLSVKAVYISIIYLPWSHRPKFIFIQFNCKTHEITTTNERWVALRWTELELRLSVVHNTVDSAQINKVSLSLMVRCAGIFKWKTKWNEKRKMVWSTWDLSLPSAGHWATGHFELHNCMRHYSPSVNADQNPFSIYCKRPFVGGMHVLCKDRVRIRQFSILSSIYIISFHFFAVFFIKLSSVYQQSN